MTGRVKGLLASLLLCACDEEFKPESLVEDFRVLALSIEPPELAPGGSAVAQAFVVDPSRKGKRNTVVWLACDPDPFNLGRSACTNQQEVLDTDLLTNDTGQAPQLPPPGMRVIGYNDLGHYTAPKDLFAALPPDDPRRLQGSIANVIALAVADEVPLTASQEVFDDLFTRIKRKQVRSLAVLSRIRVTEQEAKNHNPTVDALVVDGAILPAGATLRVLPGARLSLDLTAPEAAFEAYSLVGADGQSREKTESLVVSWYSSFGRFSHPRMALRSDTQERFTAPPNQDEALPEQREGSLYAVVRDTRGGQTLRQYPLLLCDPALPSAQVDWASSSVDSSSGKAVLTLFGKDLSQVADVMVGGRPLRDVVVASARGVLEGLLPELSPGEHPIVLLGKNCAQVETGKSYRAP